MSDILALADVHPTIITRLSESRTVIKLFEMSPEKQLVFLSSSAVQSIACILSNGHKGASNQIISALPNLKIVACFGVGVDAVDLDSGLCSCLFMCCQVASQYLRVQPTVLTLDQPNVTG